MLKKPHRFNCSVKIPKAFYRVGPVGVGTWKYLKNPKVTSNYQLITLDQKTKNSLLSGTQPYITRKISVWNSTIRAAWQSSHVKTVQVVGPLYTGNILTLNKALYNYGLISTKFSSWHLNWTELKVIRSSRTFPDKLKHDNCDENNIYES